MDSRTKALCDFLDASHSVYHAQAYLAETLKNAGYTGYLCLEALPGRLDPDICAVKGAEFFRQMTTCAAYHTVV